RVGNERHRLDRRMELKLVQAARPERVDPGVVPDVRPRATVASQFNVVEMGLLPNTEDADQLMLAAVGHARDHCRVARGRPSRPAFSAILLSASASARPLTSDSPCTLIARTSLRPSSFAAA